MKKQQKDIPRRHFLRSALGSSLCSSAFLNACAKIEEPQSWKMTLSTSSVQYRTESLEEALRRIGKMGFEGIDIWSHFEWGGPLCKHLEEGLEAGMDQFTAFLKENHLRLTRPPVTGYRQINLPCNWENWGGVLSSGAAPMNLAAVPNSALRNCKVR
jgi:hypothetical protein